ncbi:MAG: phosphoribosylformylglycinamidine cyclo-ligase [Nitrososphaeraceae archaeon]
MNINTYKKSGVNIQKIRYAQKNMEKNIEKSYNYQNVGKIISGFGHYSGLIGIGKQVLALHTDGVGTKVLIAQALKKFDTVGIDCVAMNVNDIICTGAEPFAFVDYIGLKSANKKIIGKIIKGLIRGAKLGRVSIVGGETAVIPELVAGDSDDFFDLSGTAIGVTEEKKLILGDKIEVGDKILGIESTGLHSNGYTLARKVLSKYSMNDSPEFLDQSLGEELLKPTRIYVEPIMKAIKDKKIKINGLAHITGGSFTKLNRLNKKINYNLEKFPEIRGIFKQIQYDGKIETKEMYKTFNMGIGFCIILSPNFVDLIQSIFDKCKMKIFELGHVDKGTGKVIVKIDGKSQILV